MIRDRNGQPKLPQGPGGNEYLASVSDLMSGLMFFFIITLMVFSLQLKRAQDKVALEQMQTELEQESAEKERDRLKLINEALTSSRARRDEILREFEKILGVTVKIDYEHGILRLPNEILFDSGSADLKPEGQKMLGLLGAAFVEILPKYTFFSEDAAMQQTDSNLDALPNQLNPITDNAPQEATIEAVFVEGHTDDKPLTVGGRFKDNWDLSAARAIRTYRAMEDSHPSIKELLNEEMRPIFSVSGYSEFRPAFPNDSDENRGKNRRIDFRFIMSPPKARPEAVEEVEKNIAPIP